MDLNNYLLKLTKNISGSYKEEICIFGTESIVEKLYKDLKKQKNRKVINLLKEASIKYQTFYSWKTGHNPIPISKLNKILLLWSNNCSKNNNDIELIWNKIYKINKGFSQNGQRKVKLPTYLSEDMGYIIGFFQGDGHLKKDSSQEYSLYFYESDIQVIQLINKIIEKNFGIKGNIYKGENDRGHKWYVLRICSKPIYLFFKNVLGLKSGKKIRNIEAPDIIKNSNEDVQINFIRGFFDAEGTIGENIKCPWLEIGQASKDKPCEILFWIKNKLDQKGIKLREPRRIKNQEFFRIRTSKRETIKRFFDKISTDHPKKIKKFESIIKCQK